MVQFLLLAIMSMPLFAKPMEIEGGWEGISTPLLMSNHFENRFYMLPLKGRVDEPEKYWSGDYWAMYKGSINRRWNAPSKFKRPSPSKSEIKNWTQKEISQLSPSEKFDLLNGRYYYPLKEEVKKLASYDAQKWEGICHGWAPASMNHNEPTPKTLKNPDGIMIPFGSADIKAILSYYYAYPYVVDNTHQVGRRCDDNVVTRDPHCKQDTNAGAFHMILTNRIALENIGFVADMARYQKVWNYPIISYSSKITGEGKKRRDSAPGTTRTVRIKTTLTYADESINTWNPLLGTKAQKYKKTTLNYILELNERGEIIGGVWKSLARPDFLWIKERPRAFKGNYVKLGLLLND